jgi:hypothetical protein
MLQINRELIQVIFYLSAENNWVVIDGDSCFWNQEHETTLIKVTTECVWKVGEGGGGHMSKWSLFWLDYLNHIYHYLFLLLGKKVGT